MKRATLTRSPTKHRLECGSESLKARELDDFEEVVGQITGYEVNGGNVVVTIRTTHKVTVMSSAAKAFANVKFGDHVAIVRIGDRILVRTFRSAVVYDTLKGCRTLPENSGSSNAERRQ